MKRKILSVILISLISMIPFFETLSMVRPDSLEANKLYSRASGYWRDMQYDSSNIYYEKAAAIFLKDKNWINYIECQQKMGINYRYLENYKGALEHLNSGLYALGNLILNQDSLRAELFGSIGTIYYDMGYYNKSYQYYSDMLDINKRIFGTYHPNTGKGYQNVGLIFYRTGEYNKALQNFNEALSIWDSTLSKDNPLLANGYTYISKVYFLKDEYSQSIAYEEKALNIWVQKLGESHPYITASYENLANTYSYNRNYAKALEYAYKAMQIRRENAGEESPQVAESYAEIGNVFLKMGNFNNSKYFLNKSVAVYNTIDKSNPGLADAYIFSGSLSRVNNDYETAIAYYDSAIQVVKQEYNPADINPENTGIIPFEKQFLTALIEKANTLYLMADKSPDFLISQEALNAYKTASVLLKNLRSGFRGDEQEHMLIKRFHEVNNKGLLTALKLYNRRNRTEYIDSAFMFSERDKAAIIAESVDDPDITGYAGVPDSLIAREQEMKADLYFYETKMKGAEESENLKAAGEYRYSIYNSRRSFDKLLGYIRENFPFYYKLKYPEPLTSTDEIRKLLPQNAAVLEYFSGDTSITIFVIRNSSFNAVTVPCDSNFLNNVKKLRESLPAKNFINFLASASALYSKLIDPVSNYLRGTEKLYIIPDYMLAYLPFDVLLTRPLSRTFNGNFVPLPYLINYYTISYQYSSELLRETLLEKENNTEMSFAGFASFIPNDKRLNKIYAAVRNNTDYSGFIMNHPSSEPGEEIRSVGKLFGEHNFKSDLFTDQAATEIQLKSDRLYSYKFIQLAAPAVISDEYPEQSALLLYSSDTDSAEAGMVYTRDLYKLKLNADLVVLSASETIPGTKVTGKGIYAVTRGFQYAGANNLVVSFWPTEDKSTVVLITNLYKNILNGMDYASALRKAKLDMIRGGQYPYPLDWSPYILIGR